MKQFMLIPFLIICGCSEGYDSSLPSEDAMTHPADKELATDASTFGDESEDSSGEAQLSPDEQRLAELENKVRMLEQSQDSAATDKPRYEMPKRYAIYVRGTDERNVAFDIYYDRFECENDVRKANDNLERTCADGGIGAVMCMVANECRVYTR